LVINPLVDFKIVEQVVNATEIGTLTGIIIGTAMEFLPSLIQKLSKNLFQDKHLITLRVSFYDSFWFSFPRLNIYTGSLYG
jgi:hypothetical protein